MTCIPTQLHVYAYCILYVCVYMSMYEMHNWENKGNGHVRLTDLQFSKLDACHYHKLQWKETK